MTETSYAAIPAGWYPDPRGSRQRRWWDGTSWTHALESPPEPVASATPGYANLPGPQVHRQPSPDAPTVHRALGPEARVHDLPTRRQLRESGALVAAGRQPSEPSVPSPVYAMGPVRASEPRVSSQQQLFPIEQRTVPAVETAIPAYQPFGMTPKITTGTIQVPTSVNTLSVWLLTALPAAVIAIAAAIVLSAPDFSTPFTHGALVFVFAIVGVGLAVNDRRQLTLRSHQATAPPAWVLLTPLAYLVARAATTKRQAGRGWAPAIVLVLLTAAAVALAYAAGVSVESFVG